MKDSYNVEFDIYMYISVCFSVKNVVGLGEGAGANILARFAVSISMLFNAMSLAEDMLMRYGDDSGWFSPVLNKS